MEQTPAAADRAHRAQRHYPWEPTPAGSHSPSTRTPSGPPVPSLSRETQQVTFCSAAPEVPDTLWRPV